jgi:hypothetical protein
MTSKELLVIYKKSSNLGFFLFQKGIKGCRNFCPEKRISKIGQGVYLQAHRTLNLYVQYLGKILKFVRGGLPPSILLIPIILKKFYNVQGVS